MSETCGEDVREAEDVEESSNPIDAKSDNSKNVTGANPVQYSIVFELQFWEKIWQLEQRLADELNKINFKGDKNIAAIYNPLDYCADVHINYMKKFLKKSPTVLFLGMNPGLFGMCQTSASD